MACMNIKHILCPIDFSIESDLALKYTEFLANKYGARVTVIHAERFEAPLEFTSAQIDGLVVEMKKLKKNANSHLRSYVKTRRPSLDAEYKIVENSPIEAILAETEAHDIDLIVMGTTGRSGIKRFMIGSVAESVTRESKIPVLTIRDKPWGSESELKLERILAPINYVQPAARVLESAACLSATVGADLLITHIVESGDYDENAAKEQLCRWAPDLVREKCQYDTIVQQGNAAEQIIKLAIGKKADLVVIAAVHRPFLETTIIGVTSEQVMRHASCPVLVIPMQA